MKIARWALIAVTSQCLWMACGRITDQQFDREYTPERINNDSLYQVLWTRKDSTFANEFLLMRDSLESLEFYVDRNLEVLDSIENSFALTKGEREFMKAHFNKIRFQQRIRQKVKAINLLFRNVDPDFKYDLMGLDTMMSGDMPLKMQRSLLNGLLENIKTAERGLLRSQLRE